jgi:hypothetical protein
MVATHHAFRICINLITVPLLFVIWKWLLIRIPQANGIPVGVSGAKPAGACDVPAAEVNGADLSRHAA